ncbi:2-oxoglutarate-dependent ethylene/succinate-forming enzyme [Ilyonectria robusta]|uniref:2-oxoglutarate-dependent ethylene/succinate-forming enzyme n=1 Tax=Ilyonectria robusta TaxID=1079257 RepID=UPI001E8DC029|nr:2-oxoglutarate-dependent ethylene/succinate-forming enzyme [Ilyonectria robusta]KAH8653915.1 2-oxoglutarate-dependent ethylene/succinate-forming enzyme [Ilyonectria robusta]
MQNVIGGLSYSIANPLSAHIHGPLCTFSEDVLTPPFALTHVLTATVGRLQTFTLSSEDMGSAADLSMGKALVAAWQQDGILQISMDAEQQTLYKAANKVSKRFFRKPFHQKAAGEELTDGLTNYSEIFTVTKDLDLDDPRVSAKWLCHGCCPWPDADLRDPVKKYMDSLGQTGKKLLWLIELGINIPEGSLTRITKDRFPASNVIHGKGGDGRGIDSYTDYGLLVIAAADDVGALFVRPPHKDESVANWERSVAGMKEDSVGWVFIPPAENIFTGDMMQYITNSVLPSTLHKVGLNTKARFDFAYFHEPNFQTVIKPLPGYKAGQSPEEGIHYGKHFTNIFMRNYPECITTHRLVDKGWYKLLDTEALQTITD